MWKQSIVSNLSPCIWPITLGHGATWKVQCWSLLLADWALGGKSQVSLDDWQSILLSPCKTSIPTMLVTLFMSPLGDDKEEEAGGKGWLVSTEKVTLSAWLLRSSYAEVTLG